ncbi:MAG: arylsulfatase [Cytophagales bacterium]|nr:arylsulfatase [Cytophagales bacterium]
MNEVRSIILFLSGLLLISCQQDKDSGTNPLPNMVYILADDLGYGDVGIYNPDSRIATPHIDKLAVQGMRFTDAHAPSSVCTPTRYGILTGRYCWRSRLPRGVLQGYGQSLLEQREVTVAEVLKNAGYTTGVVGKWHLGLDWQLKEHHRDSLKIYGEKPVLTNMKPDWIDFTKPPRNGPLTHGFDYSYILPASLDMPPYCYLENDTLTELPTEYTPGNDLDAPSWATGAFWRAGRISESFDFYEVLPVFIRQAKKFVTANKKDDKPFFLYLPLAAPHTPWVPKADYKGASGAGQYGDFVQMVDAHVGDFLLYLDDLDVSENTLVVFTSDNGPFWKPDFAEKFDHKAAHIYRGMKADIWDGGHRIPFIVRWPDRVAANSQSDQLTSLTNLMATVSEITGASLPPGSGMDSKSIYQVLTGGPPDNDSPVIHHSSKGLFAVRVGEWKYIEGLGSGGFSRPASIEARDGEPDGQLYNMEEDPSEKNNLYAQMPERAEELKRKLDEIRNMNRRSYAD